MSAGRHFNPAAPAGGMDLLEYEGKALFAEHGLSVPPSTVYRGGDVELPPGKRLVVKAQVRAGKRKAAGGITIVDREDAVDEADAMLGMDIEGHTVETVLLESFVDIRQEHYCSLSIARAAKAYTCVYSSEGGTGIEERAGQVDRFVFHTAEDLTEQFEALTTDPRLVAVVEALFETMRDEDAELVEINPLAETPQGFVATDAKIRLDEDAAFRHDWAYEAEDAEGLAAEAAEKGLQFVPLDGNVGVIGNGAGLVMATLDTLHHFEGRPANFLDIGGGADEETMRDAMDVVLQQDVDGAFINIFGGITRCDQVAEGILAYVEEEGVDVPLVVRMVGTNQDAGRRMLEEHGIHALDSMDACAEKIVELAGERDG